MNFRCGSGKKNGFGSKKNFCKTILLAVRRQSVKNSRTCNMEKQQIIPPSSECKERCEVERTEGGQTVAPDSERIMNSTTPDSDWKRSYKLIYLAAD